MRTAFKSTVSSARSVSTANYLVKKIRETIKNEEDLYPMVEKACELLEVTATEGYVEGYHDAIQVMQQKIIDASIAVVPLIDLIEENKL